MNIIEAHNINYNNSYKNIFHDINLDVKQGSFVSIIGSNCTGKSTLLKLLSGQLVTDNNIKIDNLQVNKYNIEEISKRVSYISSYNEFFSKTVIEEILQDKRNVSVFEVNKVRKLLDEFNLLNIEKVSVQNLSYAENQIVSLIKAIIKNPKIILLDNAFSKLDIDKRKELLDYIKEYSKRNKITVIEATNLVEDLDYSDRVLLLKDSSIVFDGNYNSLLESVDLKKEGLKLPWTLEVSNKLMLYDLIKEPHKDIEGIVEELCI